jgi:hypothetical protein
MRRLAPVVAASLISFLTACGGGSMGITTPPPPTPSVSAAVTLTSSTSGSFDLAMSTSFQPAEWDYQFFSNFPGATTPLNNLGSNHIRLQGISQGVPQTTATTWDFTILDAITQPVLTVGDHSPEFQIAVAPAFMYDSQHNFLDTTFQQFAGYAKSLVRYYNTGGFSAPDGFHVSPSSQPIQWWGIYNEPSINNVDATQYTRMYNALVPAMQSVDPTLKFVAIELCCSSESTYLPVFTSGVTAQVDVLAAHYYSSCNQKDTDTEVFSTVPSFASSVNNIYSLLSANPNLVNVPVWITENNVNADFNKGGGLSACNDTAFITDQRGSSPFFAAWRPYVFSQVGRAGARALYHWGFAADAQFGELNDQTGQPRLSYWVDYWLGQMFPAGSGQQVLQFSNSDSPDIEVLPVLNTDGSVTIMISNHAVAAAADNNGSGLTAKISLDVSALGSFTTVSQLMIDSTTSPATGPSIASIPLQSPIPITLNGYGVAFVTLK